MTLEAWARLCNSLGATGKIRGWLAKGEIHGPGRMVALAYDDYQARAAAVGQEPWLSPWTGPEPAAGPVGVAP